MKSRRRSLPYTTKSTVINHRRKLEEVGLTMRIRNQWTREQCQIFKNELNIHYD
jgi:hypothetical protein